MSNVIDILEAVSKRLGKRTKRCNCFDQTVCEFRVDNSWQPVATSGFPFTRELWADYKQRRVNLMANSEFLKCEVKGDLETHPDSIGRPGLSCFTNEPRTWLEANGRRWPVFVSDKETALETLRPRLHDPTLIRAANGLLPLQSESLHFFEGAVVLYSQPPTADAIMTALAILTSLVGTARSELDSVDLSALPPQLQDLIPYIRRWAISDDGERSELLDEASKPELEQLVAAVEQRLPEIDKYLDSFGKKGPSNTQDLALQTLGDAG